MGPGYYEDEFGNKLKDTGNGFVEADCNLEFILDESTENQQVKYKKVTEGIY
jgi:hypothetical protein